MFNLAGMLNVSYGTARYIVKLVNIGMDVSTVISMGMAVLGGSGMLSTMLIVGLKKKLYKKGVVAATAW